MRSSTPAAAAPHPHTEPDPPRLPEEAAMNGNRYAGKKRVRNQHCQVRHEGRTAMSGQRRLPPAPPGPALRLRAAAGVAAVTMLVAAAGCGTGTGSAAAPATASPPGAVVVNCLARSLCYGPRQFRVAYGIQPLLDRGITGRGQTVVLLEFPPAAAGSPPAVTDIRQDLERFDSAFGLPAARLQVVNTLAHAASPWLATGEEVADTGIGPAVAPDAAIREVLIPSAPAASPGKVSAAVVGDLRLGPPQGAPLEPRAGEGEQG